MPTWMRFAWLNRERIVAVARKLKVPVWALVMLALLAAVGGALYWGHTRGYIHWVAPTGWSPVQWVLLVVYLLGFVALYVDQRLAMKRQDEVWDDVDQLRSEVEALREQLHQATSRKVEVETSPSTLHSLRSARPLPPPPKLRPVEPPTVSVPVVRAEPQEREQTSVVQRDLGGRTFTFRG